MIVTRKWLEEFINLDNISTDEIVKNLNSIGQEVEGLTHIRIPQKVVVGYVESCLKHPDADKLNICQVNVGEQTLQIICGAKNVAQGQYVAVSLVGAVLPGNFKIKKAKLRGVESVGMICSSTELGLPPMEDGIMVLDNSIGNLTVGEEVSKYLDDDVIELGITPNRGDCFSIFGIARELSAKFNIPLKEVEDYEDDKNAEGLGRILQLDDDINNSSHLLKAVNCQKVNIPFKIKYRLALTQEEITNTMLDYATYTTVATGVIVTIYDNCKKLIIKEEDGIDIVKTDDEILYQTGLKLFKKPSQNQGDFIIDANFVLPEYISTLVYEKKLQTDNIFFRSSRGSNPNLKFAINYILKELCTNGAKVYNGTYDLTKDLEEKIINVQIRDIYAIIGEIIDENVIANILNKLQIKTTMDNSDKTLRLKIPTFRHDLANKFDIAEEVLRIYGIDRLTSKPLVFAEKVRKGQYDYITKIKHLRLKSIANGFFEVLHFIFDNSQRMKKYGFTMMDEKLDILNPIVSELDTLRQTLILQMLQSATNNKNNGYKKIPLFAVGSVYNHLREEYQKIGFVWSGARCNENITISKPKDISFAQFVNKIAKIIGDFELKEDKHILLAHPYQSAKVLIEGVEVGYIAKLHPKIAKDFDLDDTFIAEFFIDLLPNKEYLAQDIIKYQKSTRDLSIVIDKDITYSTIREIINDLHIKDIIEFYPIDIFDLVDKNSLTIRFVLQNPMKSLTDEEINEIIEQILKTLEEKIGAKLR
ncbi:MAG: phenylalanine--tRNA ligase subunit beta [Epsilonproteobacteria bacterium]|nr:phenylalanine--tRNA ligase subunit beta [Campylobacterota bacterium]